MDESYQTYLNRVMRMTVPETYQSQVQHLQESAKFILHPTQGVFQAAPFPGYSVITPPAEDEVSNGALYESLTEFQQKIIDRLEPQTLAPVPPSSFHVTLADLIWDSAYRHVSKDDGFETQLQDQIRQIFQPSQTLTNAQPLQFQVLGLLVMPRAIAVCLVPTDETSYDRIIDLRRTLYQNQDMMRLGIEQQYYFTAHITLAYFGDLSRIENREQLSDRFIALNDQWQAKEPQTFEVHRAELRKFDDMTRYYREPEWPVLQF